MSRKFSSNEELREDPRIAELYDEILRRYPDHPLIREADGIVRW